MSGARLVAAVISSGVSAFLREAGFVRKGTIWRRTVEHGTQVLEVKTARGSSAQSAELVLELGVQLPAIEKILGERPVREPREYDGTVRTRMGPKGRKNDPWWLVQPGDEARVGALVVTTLSERVLPWFELVSDPRRLSAALDDEAGAALWTPGRLTPAALALHLGKKTLARKRLRHVETEIRATLAERHAQFGDADPFGRDVLKLAARLLTNC